jgi:CheY-like chemotaxis protein
LKPILLIEDNKVKASLLGDAVMEAFQGTSRPKVAETVSMGTHLLNTSEWSGLVLDLAFQRARGIKESVDKPQLAGVKILQHLNQRRFDIPVIVATQHSSFTDTEFGDFSDASELAALLQQAFPRNFRGLLEIDITGDTWKRQFINLIKRNFK